jgi:hypothetical protein
MQILKDFTLKELNNVVPGELILLNFDGPTFAIAMQRVVEQGTIQIVILSSHSETIHPYWTTLTNNHDVMSYGTDWVFDIGSATDCSPGDLTYNEVPGTVLISNADVLLRAGSDGRSGRSRSGYYSLNTFSVGSRSINIESTVIVTSWKIWPNLNERDRRNGETLVEFQAFQGSVEG